MPSSQQTEIKNLFLREPIRDKGRLEHIIEYAENVEQMIKDVTFEQFNEDKVLYFAVMKNVEVVGEAAYMLSKEFIIMHPQMPWQQIIGMRHVLVHGYATISKLKLWNTAKSDIPALKQQALLYLKEFE